MSFQSGSQLLIVTRKELARGLLTATTLTLSHDGLHFPWRKQPRNVVRNQRAAGEREAQPTGRGSPAHFTELSIPTTPPNEHRNVTPLTNRREFTNPRLHFKKRRERLEVLEPLVRWTEGLDEHDRSRRTELLSDK